MTDPTNTNGGHPSIVSAPGSATPVPADPTNTNAGHPSQVSRPA